MRVVIEQVPGWWPTSVRAVCLECGYRSPMRSTSDWPGRFQAKLDRDLHRCGEDGVDPRGPR